ncbi:hypothetical protein LguiA_012244 [Lonicera macranthoides]
MAEICSSGVVVSETDSSKRCETISRAARRRRMEIRRMKVVSPETDKRRKLQMFAEAAAFSEECESSDGKRASSESPDLCPNYGLTSVCGRRRDMEDAVAVHPSFCARANEQIADLHYFGVYDGHGCSHVAMKCRDRLHELVKEEMEKDDESSEWKNVMERSFNRMDKEVIEVKEGASSGPSCRCEHQAPACYAVGSAAVVSVLTPDKIIVANCGDSRAVLCRSGKAIPLSVDHKPDRPDELKRIEAEGGRVIYWDCARVLGVLALSRAIGDIYLKPYVSCEPEVTITDRTDEDECLILASDGLWDVVSNETVCGVARMWPKGKTPAGRGSESSVDSVKNLEYDASMLLTKLAMSRRSSDNISVVVIDLRKEKEI